MKPLRRFALASLLCVAGHAAFVLAQAASEAPRSAPLTLLADLTPEVSDALRGKDAAQALPQDPWELLERIFAAATPYHFDAGLVGVDTDRRWFETLPSGDPAGPILEIRRWPGDSVLGVYALLGDTPAPGDPPVPGAQLAPRDTKTADVWMWDGILATPLGRRPVVWIERKIPGIAGRLGILLVPGDAGFGRAAADDLLVELLAVVHRVQVNAEAWVAQEAIAAGTAIVPPTLDAPPSDADEKRDAWQVIEGRGFTLGLPPGVRARRLDQGLSPPWPLPGALLWIRGRFLDHRGERVVIGDATRAGYLAGISSVDRAWALGEKPPLGAPRARLVAAGDASLPCEETGADGARAERWSEPGFAGQWIVFRLVFGGSGVEIGLPVVAGRQSESLFWIPTTLRAAGVPPAPPPVDPAERFGISFEQFTKLDQKRYPGFEGFLTVPGLRLTLPKGWIPVTTLRSEFGFPITVLDGRRQVVARLERLPQDSPELVPQGGSAEWLAVTRPSSRKRGAVYRRADGARLFVTAAGHGILLLPELPEMEGRTEWTRLVESAAFPRAASRKAARDSP